MTYDELAQFIVHTLGIPQVSEEVYMANVHTNRVGLRKFIKGYFRKGYVTVSADHTNTKMVTPNLHVGWYGSSSSESVIVDLIYPYYNSNFKILSMSKATGFGELSVEQSKLAIIKPGCELYIEREREIRDIVGDDIKILDV